jgi:hypothetical protein
MNRGTKFILYYLSFTSLISVLYGQDNSTFPGKRSSNHIMIMYDISQSMTDNGNVKTQDIKEWNQLLENVLFGQTINPQNYPGINIAYYSNNAANCQPNQCPLKFPIVASGDRISMYTVGKNVDRIIDNEVYNNTNLRVTNLFPSNIKDFNQPLTDIDNAELEYMQEVDAEYDEVTWVLVSDEECTKTPPDGNSLRMLRNKYHQAEYFVADLHQKKSKRGSVKLSIWKIKFDQPQELLEAKNLDLDKDNLSFHQDSSGTWVADKGKILNLMPKKGYSSGSVTDLDVWFQIFDKNYNPIQMYRFQNQSLPFVLNKLDNKEIFNSGSNAEEEYKYTLSVRYRYQGTPRNQDITTAGFGTLVLKNTQTEVKNENGKSKGWLWIIISCVGLVGIAILIGFLIKKNKKEEYSILRVGTPQSFTKGLVKGNEIKFGNSNLPSTSDLVFNIAAPDYKLVYIEDGLFDLVCQNEETVRVRSGNIFEIKDKNKNLIKLKVLKGKSTVGGLQTKKLFNPSIEKQVR